MRSNNSKALAKRRVLLNAANHISLYVVTSTKIADWSLFFIATLWFFCATVLFPAEQSFIKMEDNAKPVSM